MEVVSITPEHKPKVALEEVACPLCGGAEARTVRSNVPDLLNGLEGLFNVVECVNCRFAYTNPRPTPKSFGYFFPDNSGHYAPPIRDDKRAGNSLRRRVFRSGLSCLGYDFDPITSLPALTHPFIFWVLSWHLKNLHIPRWKPRGTLLDVGCSTGSYLFLMRSLGWHVTGVELNSTMAGLAERAIPGATIFNKPFEVAELPEGAFDVIHLGMVIDHFHDPVSALKKVRKLLKPGGVAYFSFVNFAGLESRVFKEVAYPLQVPTHLSHFTVPTFAKALGQADLQISNVSYHAVDRDWIASTRYRGWIRTHAFLSNRWIRRLLVKPFVFLFARAGLTSRVSVEVRGI